MVSRCQLMRNVLFSCCDREVTLLMLGLTNSGKTSILQRINGNYHSIHVLTFQQLIQIFGCLFLFYFFFKTTHKM